MPSAGASATDPRTSGRRARIWGRQRNLAKTPSDRIFFSVKNDW